MNQLMLRLGFVLILFFSLISCSSDAKEEEVEEIQKEQVEIDDPIEEDEIAEPFILPDIDLNNWKVTLPIGSPTEVEPPEILNYATNELLKPFMFNDSVNGALVFYTYPGSTTTNTSYSRTELREQMVPGSNSTNWTFVQGGSMKGSLSMDEISKDNDGDFHRTMVMQIHGRLTNQQRDLIGENDNNAPPVLKIYWQDEKVRVVTKQLKNVNASDLEILSTEAWEDGESFTFSENVGFEKFTVEIKVSEGRLEIILNDDTSKVFENIHMEKWGVFENYFKAGNYLQTINENAFARVKFYDLVVEH